MCLLAIPFECYRCRWREPRDPKYVVLKAGESITRFGWSGNGELRLVSSITCIHVLLDEISSQPVCYANALYLLELIKVGKQFASFASCLMNKPHYCKQNIIQL